MFAVKLCNCIKWKCLRSEDNALSITKLHYPHMGKGRTVRCIPLSSDSQSTWSNSTDDNQSQQCDSTAFRLRVWVKVLVWVEVLISCDKMRYVRLSLSRTSPG